jgi:small subunit ribosomal protein S1
LIHVSEIAAHCVATPSEVVRAGDRVRVRVVAIDPDRRRLSLSMRQASGNVVYETRSDGNASI